MAEMKKAELVLIPAASVAHLVPCVEFANLLITQNNNLSITILIMHLPFGTSILSFKNSLAESLDPRIKFIDLKPEVTTDPSSQKSPPTIHMFSQFLNSRKPLVKEILAELSKSENCKLAGVVFDVLYTSMFDVAIEFEVPYYVFSPFGASMIALMSHLQSLRDDHNVDVNDLKVSEIDVPAYINPVPTRVLPSMLLYKEGGRNVFLDVAKRYRAAKGIIINSFNELETQAIEALSKDANLPPVYAVGPLLNHKGGKWNDNQKQQQQQEGVQSIKKCQLCQGLNCPMLSVFRVIHPMNA
ncbi:OLC1v1020495C1 [Oldenlandia corymbosa var. corymbosa]|uniref:OLC1v1020495C1 n=1 Tax=Oldenlandia corymbosa var. corymbosa TaxID=529605 RepID=A0AAV1EH42_OLDCO|nr:OLC1v1020495C1 [Oldenlandia corymbosa var. corymbosa]